MIAPGLNNMLPFSTFEKLTKNEIYHLYCEVYQSNVQKDQIIQNYLKAINEKIERRTNEKQPAGGVTSTTPMDSSVIPGSTNRINKVRTFKNFNLEEKQSNLVLGSSIIASLWKDRSIPQDIAIHGYRGATTEEKISIVENYPERKLKTVVVQDGTNSILKKKHTDVSELFENYKTLIENVSQKFQPENLVLCEVPPLREKEYNNTPNERIKEFNELLSKFSEESDLNTNVSMRVLPIAQSLRNITDYNSLYYDDIHLSFNSGLPFLKNLLLSALLKTSNGIPVDRNQVSSQRYPYQRRRYPLQQRNQWYPKQTYNYISDYNYGRF